MECTLRFSSKHAARQHDIHKLVCRDEFDQIVKRLRGVAAVGFVDRNSVAALVFEFVWGSRW